MGSGVGTIAQNISIKSTLFIRLINDIGNEAAEDAWRRAVAAKSLEGVERCPWWVVAGVVSLFGWTSGYGFW